MLCDRRTDRRGERRARPAGIPLVQDGDGGVRGVGHEPTGSGEVVRRRDHLANRRVDVVGGTLNGEVALPDLSLLALELVPFCRDLGRLVVGRAGVAVRETAVHAQSEADQAHEDREHDP